LRLDEGELNLRLKGEVSINLADNSSWDPEAGNAVSRGCKNVKRVAKKKRMKVSPKGAVTKRGDARDNSREGIVPRSAGKGLHLGGCRFGGWPSALSLFLMDVSSLKTTLLTRIWGGNHLRGWGCKGKGGIKKGTCCPSGTPSAGRWPPLRC